MPPRPEATANRQARPTRPSVLDELGLKKTLPNAAGDFRTICGPDSHNTSQDTLFLGLGPDPERLPELFPGVRSARFIECPDLAAQLGPDRKSRIPANFAEAKPDDLAALVRNGARVVLYAPGPRLFPSFWGPLMATAQLALFTVAPAPRQRLAWLPGDEGGLLRIELREALEALGFTVRLTGEASVADYRALLAGGECPELFLSVNFSGLDPLGETYHLLKAAGTRVAVWCVDAPLHLLSGLKSRFWTGLPLFATDAWAVETLKTMGAAQAFHLPLAARTRNLETAPRPSAPAWADLADRLVFVGRSAFPGKEDFFAGCALPDGLWAQAQAMLGEGQRAGLDWWLEKLDITEFWPGAEVRRAGFCAEETGRAWRTLCLKHAHADLGNLTVFGDDGWKELLPEATDLRGVVDYYTALPIISASAGACLNLTNPLLPRGLTQRHFDTWAWGGLLLSDATPGLNIFPAELTREITFRAPRDLAPRFRALSDSPALAADLKTAWRAELLRAHTYGHRLAVVLERLGL
ncbi:MAG: glycosyltransferase [Proteobacteria bacterium]|nr:glycosyltransferase [Pseudomonadota bacterium]